jgi:hypothetical protein
VKFEGSEKIVNNYSQAYQDMFALTVSDGKRNGTFIEIGAGDPYYRSNTALLEEDFDWSGLCIDVFPEVVEKFNKKRKTQALALDATIIDYKQLFRENNIQQDVDYLHIDCGTVDLSYSALERIPFDEYKFRLITYKHDYYFDSTKSFRNKSRQFFIDRGYKLLIADISPDSNTNYEDWWVHPDLVDAEFISRMEKDDGEVTRAKDYMLEGL